MKFGLETAKLLADAVGADLALALGALQKAKDYDEAKAVCEYLTPGHPNYGKNKPACLGD